VTEGKHSRALVVGVGCALLACATSRGVAAGIDLIGSKDGVVISATVGAVRLCLTAGNDLRLRIGAGFRGATAREKNDDQEC
jgi:hypothetical protein